MIRSFGNAGTEDIFYGRNTKAARKTCPQMLWKIAARKLEQLDSIADLKDLRVPPGNRLEALAGDLRGFFSIRINEQYRICFRWTGQDVGDVAIMDYHRG